MKMSNKKILISLLVLFLIPGEAVYADEVSEMAELTADESAVEHLESDENDKIISVTSEHPDMLYWNFDEEHGELLIEGRGNDQLLSCCSADDLQQFITANEDAIDTVRVGDDISLIPSSMFYGMPNLKTVVLSDDVTQIESQAFANCESLADIRLPDSLESIGERAFFGCSNLKELTLPAALTEIGNHAFEAAGVTNLTVLGFPDGYNDAFRELDNLTELTIDADSVPAWAYEGNESLVSISVKASVIGEGAFCDCPSLQKAVLNVGQIKKYAFWRCGKLSELQLNEPLHTIGVSAFANCSSMKKFELPDSVTTLKSDIFEGCENCHQIVIGRKATSISGSAFSDILSFFTIITPYKSYAYYYAWESGIPVHTDESVLLQRRFTYSDKIPESATGIVGECISLTVANSSGDIRWKSSKKSVAKVDNEGYVSLRKKGTATITAEVDGRQFSQKITVYPRKMNKVLNTIYRNHVRFDMADKDKILAANMWLQSNVTYAYKDTVEQDYVWEYGSQELIPDSSAPHVHDEVGALVNGRAVCDGYAKAFKKIMDHYGIPCKIITGTADTGIGIGSHAWDLVKIGKNWFHIDPTWGYGLMTDKAIKKDHFWNKENYPASTSSKINKSIMHTGISGAVVNKAYVVLKNGEETKLTVTGTNKTVTYQSSNPSIATVDKNGNVTAIQSGTTNIVIKIGSSSVKCKIVVE